MRGCLLALGVTLALASCGDPCGEVLCGPCGSPLTLRMRDSVTRLPVSDVTITGAPADCGDGGTTTVCSVGDFSTGARTYDLVISAPGHVPLRLRVEVPKSDGGSCCDCGYREVSRDVSLDPE